MSDFKKDLDHAKKKAAGEVKEAAGKVTGNEQLELKGKLQSGKADLKKNLKKNLNAKEKMEKAKEKVAGKINDRIDKNKKKKKKK